MDIPIVNGVICKWCGSARGIFIGTKILICPRCDYDIETIIPNEHLIKDIKGPKP